MKKYFFTVLILSVTLSLSAQKLSKEEALDLMASDTCECLKNKKINPSESLDNKQMALGLCLIASFNEHKSKSKFFSKKGLEDIEEIGEMVGMKMTTVCLDDFMSLFSGEEMVDMLEDDEDIEFSDSPRDNLNIEVELTSLKNDAISYIETKDDFDKTHTFIILDDFDGYELLNKSNYGKSFSIEYEEKQVFDLSEKQYITKKVITKIDLID
ncbi:MAG: hypothetical protein HRU50_03415 [Winogradskyella sp.]|uniref:hypothetical protein n=1 Tax=Winogradskyella sp. TaxID=1883156 RepID=UPI0025F7DDAD|nr:hypothetical protein [Winogradskyella sp.]NRB58974.1 hypothetical protein [Winogradskyella sp.]